MFFSVILGFFASFAWISFSFALFDRMPFLKKWIRPHQRYMGIRDKVTVTMIVIGVLITVVLAFEGALLLPMTDAEISGMEKDAAALTGPEAGQLAALNRPLADSYYRPRAWMAEESRKRYVRAVGSYYCALISIARKSKDSHVRDVARNRAESLRRIHSPLSPSCS